MDAKPTCLNADCPERFGGECDAMERAKTDSRPLVTPSDIDRAWYREDKDGWVLTVRFRKDGESGNVNFGKFLTKAEAQDFLVQLKKVVV